MQVNSVKNTFFVYIFVTILFLNFLTTSANNKEDINESNLKLIKPYLNNIEDLFESSRAFTNRHYLKISSNMHVPLFTRIPSNAKIGDLIFCDIKPCFANPTNHTEPGFSNEHVAMYMGNNKIIHAMPFGGVRIVPFNFLNTWATNIVFASVDNTTESQRENAVKWAKSRLFKPYQFNPHWPSNPNPFDEYDKYSDCWTCSELIWAAYWNNGVNMTFFDIYKNSHYAVLAYNLLVDDRITLYQNIPPIAHIGYFPNYFHDQPRLVFFYGYGYDSDLKYRWDFKNNGTWTNWSEYYYSFYNYTTFGNHTIKLQIEDNYGYNSEAVLNFEIFDNRPPYSILHISCPKDLTCGKEYKFNFVLNDPDGDNLTYFVNWGDGFYETFGPYKPNQTFCITHKWQLLGNFTVFILAFDDFGACAEGTDMFNVTVSIDNATKNIFERFLEKHIRLEMVIQEIIGILKNND